MTASRAQGDAERRRPRWRVWGRWAVRALLTVVGVIAALGALTPVGRYIARAALEEGKILARRRPIDEMLSDSAVSRDVRARLRLVADARAFGVRTLGLEAEESFTTYSHLERDTLVLLVSAARRDTLAQYTWWFPVVGRVPYKGFFDYGQALGLAQSLRQRGFDTYVRPAAAFSTLGWFNDPLLTTTLRLDTLSLAETVIHELTHNTLFVRGQVTFNESFASFVGTRGAADFFRARGAVGAAERIGARWNDEKQLGAFWSALAHAVDSAFAAHANDSTARVAAGDQVYTRMRRVLLDDLAPRMPTISRRGLEDMQLDNAALLAHRVYASDLWLFDELHRRAGGSLAETIRLIQQLVREGDGGNGSARGAGKRDAGDSDPYGAMRAWMARASGDADAPAAAH